MPRDDEVFGCKFDFCLLQAVSPLNRLGFAASLNGGQF